MRLKHWQQVLGGSAVTALLLAGCGGGGSDADEDTYSNVTQAATVTVDTDGAKKLRFDGSTELQILEADGPGQLSVLVIGTDKPVDVGDHATVEAFVQLMDYDGDGKYVAGGSETAPQKLVNNAYVQYVRRPPDGPVEVVRYDLVRKPCTFEIKKDGSEGSADCKGLATHTGDEITLRMKWKGTGRRVVVPTTAPPPGDPAATTTTSSTP